MILTKESLWKKTGFPYQFHIRPVATVAFAHERFGHLIFDEGSGTDLVVLLDFLAPKRWVNFNVKIQNCET